MSDQSKPMTIGQLASAAQVGVETIRYYQRRQLLRVPERPYGGIRHYGPADIERLRFIKSAQRLGFSLDEVADLLRLDDGTHCNEASRLAERKLSDIRKRIASLQSMETVLAELTRRCQDNKGNIGCPVIASLRAKSEL